MKKILISVLSALALTTLLCSCESTGFSWDCFGPGLTPDVDAETTVRTWQKAPNSNREVPVNTEVENPPAYE